jgi:DNA modification methylase
VSKSKKPRLPPHELLAVDCMKFMQKRWGVMDLKSRPKLVIADPPYNYGEPYDSHDDNMEWSAYMEWSKQWLQLVEDAALHPDGSVWLFYPDELVSWIDVFCQGTLGWHKRAHVIWYYTFGVCNPEGRNFSRSHTHLLYYSRKKTKFTFNDEAIRVPSARAAVYGDKRAATKGKIPDNTWMLFKHQMDAVFRGDMDTWLESRVCGTYKERQKDSPNQLPVPLVERIILATSNPGDLVYDPFVGSGTTVLAAKRNNRPSIGTDLSARYVKNAERRVAAEFPQV